MLVQNRIRISRGLKLAMRNVLEKKDGTLYYRRVVPIDLRNDFGKREIKLSLRTKDKRKALSSSDKLNDLYDEKFKLLRSKANRPKGEFAIHADADQIIAEFGDFDDDLSVIVQDKILAKRGFLHIDEFEEAYDKHNPDHRVLSVALGLADKQVIKLELRLTDALTLFLESRPQHGGKSREKYESDRRRAVDRLIKFLGKDCLVTEVTKAQARAYEKAQQKVHKADTRHKDIAWFKAMFEIAFDEMDLDRRNPWTNIQVHDPIPENEKRDPFTFEQADTIFRVMPTLNAELEGIATVTAFTGARLAEITGLDAADIELTGAIPSLTIRENKHRQIKTKASNRTIPALGPALEALRKAKEAHPAGPLFPRYSNGQDGSNRASAAIMKMVRDRAKITDLKYAWHSWRHTMADAMREAGVEETIAARIMGHARKAVADNYGKGYSLEIMKEALDKSLQPLFSLFACKDVEQ